MWLPHGLADKGEKVFKWYVILGGGSTEALARRTRRPIAFKALKYATETSYVTAVLAVGKMGTSW